MTNSKIIISISFASLFICILFNCYLLHKAIYNSYYKQNIYRSIKLARLIEATITVKTLSIEQKKKIID